MHSDDLTQQYQLWQEEMRGRVRHHYADTTIEGYTRQFKRYLKELSSIIPHRGLTIQDVVDDGNMGRVLARIPFEQFSTRYQMFSAVVVFCRFLEQRKLVDPKRRIDLWALKPRRKSPPHQSFFKDEEQTAKFYDAIWTASGNTAYDKHLLTTICMILDHTGMRRSELCNLLKSDVSIESGEILIRCGKGGKPRRLGINPRLRHALNEYLKVRPFFACNHFLVSAEGKPIKGEYLSKRIMRTARRAGLDVTTHSFRRTYATRMALAGQSLPLIQNALGHSTLAMANVYVKLQEQNLVQAMQAFDWNCNQHDGATSVSHSGARQTEQRWIQAKLV